MINTHSIGFVRGSSQFAYCADNADVSITGDFTLEVYMKLTQKSSTAGVNFGLVSKYNSGDNKRSYGWLIATGSDKMIVFISDDGSSANTHLVGYTSVTALTTIATYVHVAVSFDISEEDCKFLINGVSENGVLTTGSTIGASIHDNDSIFQIGNYDEGGAAYFDGKKDDVRIHNTVRSEAWVAGNRDREIVPDANCVGYWKFNEDALDSAKSSDLTLSGSPAYSTDVAFPGAGGGFLLNMV